ncbi:unannotated protein [freshwater metagenome]|uniref:Unannotated protein n=1 Tax=freshwater metagenome TaxID=449393 RepID=A0A6J6J7T9_9ZZZZ
MHWSKGHVHTNDHQPKVPFTNALAQPSTEHLRPPIIKACKESEHCTAEQHIVKVSHDVVGIGLLSITRCYSVSHSRKSTDRELCDKTDGEQHWNGEGQLAAPHSHHPVDNLDTSWNGDRHSRHGENSDRHRTQTRSKHMVGPNSPADESNRCTRHSHDRITKQWLLGEHGNDFTDNAERRQDQDIHLGMPEDPE